MRIIFSAKHAFLLALMVSGCSSNGSTPAATEATEAQSKALERLAQESPAAAWKWSVHPHTGAMTHLRGRSTPLMTRGVTGQEATLTFLARHKELYKMVDPSRELSLVRETRDELSNSHVRMQQTVGGIQVRGGELIAHYDGEGALTSLDARYAPGLAALDLHPALSAEQVHATATSDILAEEPSLAQTTLVTQTSPTLQIFAPEDTTPRLAYHVRLRGDGHRPVLMDYMIDAQTGAILENFDDIETVTATGIGINGDVRTLNVTPSGDGYKMLDSTRGAATITTTTAGGDESTPGTVVRGSATVFDATGPAKGSAVDAHFFTGVVYDYYKKTHGRAGIDGKDSPLIATVHYGSEYNNAFWDGEGMTYGDGDGSEFKGFAAALDVIAHELTHGVTQNTSGLIYSKQSGALNEAVSDIFGSFVEHALRPDPIKNFILGEDLTIGDTKPFRDLIHPSKGRQPSNMKQFVNTTTDNGGVHTNSGIVNNAMFLMTIGGTNDFSKIVVPFGIGWEKSEKLWFKANTTHFMSGTSFLAAAQATLATAIELQFSQNDQNIVECAWIATGVLPGTCKPIVEDRMTPDAGAVDAGSVDAEGTRDGGSTRAADAGAGRNTKTAPWPTPDTPEADPTAPAPPLTVASASIEEPVVPAESGCSAAPGEAGSGTVLFALVGGVVVGLRRRRRRHV